ncbi:MAG: MAE_28990/MAE_18760 family HEPN-like nuclease [Syntrophorhabdaceae bacterium]|nr:MAE_28990/MAE_18760 family HEPN-like nuclease [Syntrophorhabdaceae bacterium]
MNKIRNLSMLQDYLDGEFSWRIKEIANLKLSICGIERKIIIKTLIRPAIPLLYAHWEGFVKNASMSYVNFVDCQGLRYSELSYCFVVFGLKKKLSEVAQSKKSHINVAAIEFLLSELSSRAQLKIESAINTESNLNSKVFANIALSIGIDPAAYETRYNLIDESLLGRRNNIAHGEYLDLSAGELRNLAEEIIGLLRQYKTDIENAAAMNKFKRDTPDCMTGLVMIT